jgi:nucleoside-triphosphatase THEP1
MAFRKAERRKAKLRLGLAGGPGSGKTASALLIAYGITGDWAKIGIADTENHSGELYVNAKIGGVQIGEYQWLGIEKPYTPQKYIDAIKEAEMTGLECIILDSLTHAWAGEGGLLDQQGAIADKSGNSWTAWRKVTPLHNQLVETMLGSKIHVIATIRAKMDYAQVEENGRKQVKKLGMAPIQREGMEYEFTSFFDLSQDHTASSTKDRTSLFDGQFFKPSVDTGKALLDWLETGVDEPAPQATMTTTPATPQTQGNTERRPSEAQIKRLFAIAHEHSVDDAALKKSLLEMCNKTSTKDLTIDEYNRLVAWLESA